MRSDEEVNNESGAELSLKKNYEAILEVIKDKAVLVAATKTFPAEKIESAYDLGIRDFAESKIQEAEEKIRQSGGHPTSSISQKTDYLIAGENPGSKYDKALKLGVKIITEKELLNLLKL